MTGVNRSHSYTSCVLNVCEHLTYCAARTACTFIGLADEGDKEVASEYYGDRSGLSPMFGRYMAADFSTNGACLAPDPLCIEGGILRLPGANPTGSAHVLRICYGKPHSPRRLTAPSLYRHRPMPQSFPLC